jgi:pyrimidine-nucleoside phosphorylase
MGQSEELAPADRRMYALRDVTATIESIPLITASILGKKLAEDIDGLVMDIKTGSGAFMPTVQSATGLARSIVEVCRKAKTKITAVITDMEQPLGRTIGNALEVRECIDFLNGSTSHDLEDLCITLSAYMIRMGGRARTYNQASRMAYDAVSSGEAARRFRQIVRLQGGDERIVDDPGSLVNALHVRTVFSPSAGFVTRCDAKLLGLASNALGAGRSRVDDVIDPAVGICLEKKMGDKVVRGDALCQIHWNDEDRLNEALPLIQQAFEIKSGPPKPRALIHTVLEN